MEPVNSWKASFVALLDELYTTELERILSGVLLQVVEINLEVGNIFLMILYGLVYFVELFFFRRDVPTWLGQFFSYCLNFLILYSSKPSCEVNDFFL